MMTTQLLFRYNELGEGDFDTVNADPSDVGPLTSSNINDWIEGHTHANIDATNINPANIDGLALVPSLRTLGNGGVTAAAGDDPRFSDDRVASGLRTTGGVVDVSGSAPPIVGQAPIATGPNSAIWQTPGVTAEVAGSGTVVTTIGLTAVTGTGTNFTILRPGFYITVNGERQLIDTITDDTNLDTVGQWMANNAGQAWSFIIAGNPRPFNRLIAKSADFLIGASDAGNTFVINASVANVVGSLPAANFFFSGDTVALVIDTEGSGTLAGFAPNGGDLIDGLNTSVFVSAKGAVIVLVSDGVSAWATVTERRKTGSIIQRKRRQDAAVTANIVAAGVTLPTGTQLISTGTEILTSAGALKLTPTSRFNTIRVRGLINGSSGNNIFLAAIVSDGVAVVGAAVKRLSNPGDVQDLPFEFTYVAGGVAEITFRLALAVSGNHFHFNGDNSGAQLLGGQSVSWIEVTEEGQ